MLPAAVVVILQVAKRPALQLMNRHCNIHVQKEKDNDANHLDLFVHRSIRHFTDEPISKRSVRRLLTAPVRRPVPVFACGSIIRITDKSVREEPVTLTGWQKHVAQGGVLVFCADFERHFSRSVRDAQPGRRTTVACVVDSGNDGAECINRSGIAGIGRRYISAACNNIEAVTKLLKLPQHVPPLFGLRLGWPADNPDLKPRLPSHFGA